ncbi:hypothetical protein LTR28_004902 [Elasticomyces elasticus]|nr:hypothetical protein LTR28_004902 [Elasticomyces elasticus]
MAIPIGSKLLNSCFTLRKIFRKTRSTKPSVQQPAPRVQKVKTAQEHAAAADLERRIQRALAGVNPLALEAFELEKFKSNRQIRKMARKILVNMAACCGHQEWRAAPVFDDDDDYHFAGFTLLMGQSWSYGDVV